MDDEELYFKAKYLKYKLKYVALKKQHIGEGGGGTAGPEPEPEPDQQLPALKKAGSDGNSKAKVVATDTQRQTPATKVVATKVVATGTQTLTDKMDASFKVDADRARATVLKNEAAAKKIRDAAAAVAADIKARAKIAAEYKKQRLSSIKLGLL